MLYWGELKNKKVSVVENDSTVLYLKSFSAKKEVASRKVNQAVYENYFEVCKSLIRDEKSMTLKKIEVQLQQFLNVLQTTPKKNQKMIQNFSQLLQAIKDNNLRYFGIESLQKKTV